MRTCVRRMSVRGKKEFEVRKIDRNERISHRHTLRESMIELGFEGLVSDAGLFIFRNEQGFVIAVIYVDDSLF